MKVIVIVDMQNDFIDGALGSDRAKEIVPVIVDKINEYPDKSNTLVLFTKDTHYDDYLETLEGKKLPIKHCIENTPGWSINREVKDAVKKNRFLTYSSDKIIKSRIYKNTFGSDDLREVLLKYKDDIEQVELFGLCTDVCVVSNALMARQALPNTEIIVDASCCGGTTLSAHIAAIETMQSCQIDVINNYIRF